MTRVTVWLCCEVLDKMGRLGSSVQLRGRGQLFLWVSGAVQGAWHGDGAGLATAAQSRGKKAAQSRGRRLHSTGLLWIIVLVFTQRSPVEVYEKGGSCSITALSITRTSELVSSNMRGQLKTWDVRSKA